MFKKSLKKTFRLNSQLLHLSFDFSFLFLSPEKVSQLASLLLLFMIDSRKLWHQG